MQGFFRVHFLRFGFGKTHTTTPPLRLHLGFLFLGLPSGKLFLGLFGLPSGDTPASVIIGNNNPIKRKVENTFFTTKIISKYFYCSLILILKNSNYKISVKPTGKCIKNIQTRWY